MLRKGKIANKIISSWGFLTFLTLMQAYNLLNKIESDKEDKGYSPKEEKKTKKKSVEDEVIHPYSTNFLSSKTAQPVERVLISRLSNFI